MIPLLLLGCGAAPQPAPAPVVPVADCEPVDVRPIDRTVPVRVFADRSVDQDAAELVAGARDYWARYGVRLQVSPLEAVDLPAPLVGSDAEIDAALRGRGVDPGSMDPPPRQVVLDVVREVVLTPTIRHLERVAVPVQPGIHVVVVPRIAASGSPGDRAFARIDGLTLHPDLAGRDDPTGELVAQLGLESFTPTVFVGIEGIERRAPDGWEGTLAHEIGHALGLEHVPDPNNLMAPEPPTCRPGLTAEQLARVGGAGSQAGIPLSPLP